MWIVLALANQRRASDPSLAEAEKAKTSETAREWYRKAIAQIDDHPGLNDSVGLTIREEAREAFQGSEQPG